MKYRSRLTLRGTIRSHPARGGWIEIEKLSLLFDPEHPVPPRTGWVD